MSQKQTDVFFLIAGGNGHSPDGTLPQGAVACTQEQYNNAAAWTIENGQIIPSPNLLATTKQQQVNSLSNACAAQIRAGFASSALGSAHTYASGDIEQQNIVQSAQSTKGGLLSCADSTGVWSRQPHTQAQAQQVLEDFVTARDASREKLSALQTKIAAATTVAAVQAINWQEATSG